MLFILHAVNKVNSIDRIVFHYTDTFTVSEVLKSVSNLTFTIKTPLSINTDMLTVIGAIQTLIKICRRVTFVYMFVCASLVLYQNDQLLGMAA